MAKKKVTLGNGDKSIDNPMQGAIIDHIDRKAKFVKKVEHNIGKLREATKQLSFAATNAQTYSYSTEQAAAVLKEFRNQYALLEEAFERADKKRAAGEHWQLDTAVKNLKEDADG